MARIVIAGGGISGLASALVLARHGHQITVLEARDTFTELGAGIQLAPNAFHALDRLGVGDQVRDAAVHIEALLLMDGVTDEQIVHMPLTAPYRQRFNNPYAVVHRMDLYAPLLAACRSNPAIHLRTDAAVAAYHQDTETVTTRLANGERLISEALIGADGINSTVREQVVGDGPPRVVGHTIFRSVIPAERVPAELLWNSVTLWAGPKWHFVHYLIGGGRYLNLAATIDNAATQPVVGEPVEHKHVLAQFPDIGGAARRLLHLGEGWRTWTLRDRDPVAGWSQGRVLLIGDAAHPMLQYAAQGACQALEDAVVLGDLLDDDFVKSFRRFAEQRHRRTRATQVLARRMGRQLFHADGRLSVARNKILGSLTPDQMYRAVEWLHGAKTA